MDEFSLIQSYFSQITPKSVLTDIGVGDDAAVLNLPLNKQLVVSVDTLVNGVHFPKDTSPYDVGYKALAVNLSDLAAMGAKPEWFTLALTLPNLDRSWLAEFSRGLSDLAQQFNVELVGGDTCSGGDLVITIQIMGFVESHGGLTRSNAQHGDGVFVTGCLGDAGLALRRLDSVDEPLLKALNRPYPRVGVGLIAQKYAHAAIDISDGFLADLTHILEKSQVGAVIEIEKIPLSLSLTDYIDDTQDWALPLTAGDDYELCIIAPLNDLDWLSQVGVEMTQVGYIQSTKTLSLTLNQQPYTLSSDNGFNHFSAC
jgi:thiamine-monophosphate kinase